MDCHSNIIGINNLGGEFIFGRPLPDELRSQHIDFSMSGVRSCEISKYLCVSYSCVLKIIRRFKITGSHKPKKLGGSRLVSTGKVVKAISYYKKIDPKIYARNIQDKLKFDGICNSENVPSLSSVNRILRKLEKEKYDNEKFNNFNKNQNNSSFIK